MSTDFSNTIKGQGAQLNPGNRFSSTREGDRFDDLNWEEETSISTTFLEIFPKTIINKVTSPDVPMEFSLNPYQGCEHGCIYCYARPTHEYWGYSSGIDFERKIMVKKNAPELFKKAVASKNWQAETVVLSGNTDCYQPIEKQLQLTRNLLQIALNHQQPVGIITKNALILRDLDIIEQLAANNLIAVNISITTLREELRRKLEPRTASAKRKLEAIAELTKVGVPVNAMLSPIIPALNDDEIFNIAAAVSQHGAKTMSYQLVRLNGENETLFNDWANHHFPDRAAKMLNQIKDIHGGVTSSSQFTQRMRGQGKYAENIRNQVSLARKKYGLTNTLPKLNKNDFRVPTDQLRLF